MSAGFGKHDGMFQAGFSFDLPNAKDNSEERVIKPFTKIFHDYEGTTHRPHCNLFLQGKALQNGEVCPTERDEPLEKPILTDRLLKLASVRPY
jgi:hypothetical protein